MGTETSHYRRIALWLLCGVKLNNPLMGTETRVQAFFVPQATIHLVKLNNPLMGTETLIVLFRYHF